MFNFPFKTITNGLAVILGTAGPAVAAVQGGTLIYLEQQAHTNLYPPSGGFYPNGGILNQITDKLTYQNPKTLEIDPWIAESWSTNPDKTEYTFKLRPGVTFSDGTPLDANAVAKNFDTYGLGNKSQRLPVSEVINNYDHSEVIDPLTVKFYFKRPSPGFLQGTATIGSGLVSLSTLNRQYDELGDARHIIGSGPFVVSGETLGREVDLSVRKDYRWGPIKLAQQGRANLDAIKVLITPEDSVRIGALQAGQADFIRQIQAYDEKQTQELGFTVYAAPTRGVNDSIAFRPDNPLVADIRVRQALLHATDSKQIVDTLFSANYPQAKSVIASSAAGFVDLSDKLTFDLSKANRLLDDAGWQKGSDGLREKAGKKLVLTVYESLPQPQNKAVLQLVSQQWGKVGARLNILAGDAGSRVADNLDPQKTPATVVEVGRADPDVIKSQFYPTNRDGLLQKGGTSKNSQFIDNSLNQLLLGIASEVDPAKRLQIAGEAQKYLLDQAYVIPFFEEPQVFAGAPYLKGVNFEAVGRPSFYGAWLEKR
ncbi:peptide/nickel transport system substrate-binding protein [Serratia fonticola]|uniref:Peptide/nickel transport system substrate-binding protein n=1 Tax=Serratia fonticola TaxID=47917 RepID=A0A542BRN3_SERFO|nr:TIGR04028 family ABC transporter substrate-binding protein [Serratia fonticola]TQI81210.1 peptide/nickel transport system substrate-binding protein [Serratia fonticola]TQI96766.1 peptide/nickel transport system substrate-binding protein [Serratia fonticola]TVZ71262.1 peptide/nickel transport system substrate-binding protein [Serratia fonticola]